jgi:hypothetical protein
MNENLALDKLSKLMEWEKAGLDKSEFEWLRLLSQFKYDQYEGYEPGSRFYTNLIAWLKQFCDLKDRRIAYEFLKNNLIFFSRQEIIHLVYRLWPEVHRTITDAVAKEQKIPRWQVIRDAKEAFDIQLRQSLFCGLSDGAKMDVFRRDNEGRISNEQAVVVHEVSQKRWNKIHIKLQKEIKNKKWCADSVFKHVFLVDDFTASGTTLIRYDDKDQEWTGKIASFIEHVDAHILHNPCHVHIHHYIGTKFSQSEIVKRIGEYKAYLDDLRAEGKLELPELIFTVTFGLVVDDRFNVTQPNCPDFYDLLGKHYDKSVQTETTGCVKYGYKECKLGIVFEHNTPNNSVGIIWAETAEADLEKTSTPMTSLFRRRTRHV